MISLGQVWIANGIAVFFLWDLFEAPSWQSISESCIIIARLLQDFTHLQYAGCRCQNRTKLPFRSKLCHSRFFEGVRFTSAQSFFFCCLVFLIFSYICVLFCWLHCRSPPFLFSRLGHAFGSWCHTLALTFTIIKQMKGTKAVRLCTLQSDSHLSFVEGLWSFSRILVLIKSYRVLNEEL